MPNNIRIDYYTGTGGSELIARLLAEKLKISNVNVAVHRIRRDEIPNTDDLNVDYYILIFPVHSFNAPKPVYEWVEHLSGKGCKTAVISVSGAGNIVTNSASRNKTVNLLKKSNFNVIVEKMLRMPNNWMNVPNEKKCMRILSKIPQKIDQISQVVLAERRSKDIVFWIDYLFSAIGEVEKKATRKFGNGIEVTDECTGCGLCAKNCCSSNIQMEKQTSLDTPIRPKFGNQCDMCLGCIYNCPQKALLPTVWAFQVDRKGYDLRAMISSIFSEAQFTNACK
ncbi:EFR1 family ferrodoxin [Bacteroidales bacterium OttesenSCG-928-B11]|nr:EFR1 family ferrodoxin [Bacteroidales bacterium OttesenSCG-928-C03]MDL2313290.1 EFR1 family ferrodoxin [Bacteroidales bacterium OttesenSCG-928-B11]MDL2326333.1 EFR1 family ferrodoxin [Bacteroidales bacterium OttesenSCG-928-A14]